MEADKIRLDKTCDACPEQYDAFDESGRLIGYLRLRHGYFTVQCPDAGGDLVYSAEPEGDGIFGDIERDIYLLAAKKAIADYYNKNLE